MIKRHLAKAIEKYAKEYPVIAIVGPRQSGKTTLAKMRFPNHSYISMENADSRSYAVSDPRGFLSDYPAPVIIDEIQRTPELFSYLQEAADNTTEHPGYVLTGSQQFLLMESISQSLAGRIAYFRLYPFTYNELYDPRADRSIEDIFQGRIRKSQAVGKSTEDILFKGMYPRIHDRSLTPTRWLENYIATYVERDIRQLVNISDLRTFENFLKMTAAQSGQLLNCTTLSNGLGISVPTVKRWLSLLETSGIVFVLQPHFRNFGKRIVKTPKVYFIDTGLLCCLLSIRNSDVLKNHPLYGSIFENFIISEFYKRIHHLGETPQIFFWRDRQGLEIDLMIDCGNRLIPVEIKSSKTFSPHLCANLKKWTSLEGNQNCAGLIVYDGERPFGTRSEISTLPWRNL
ncbi:MAG: ATP-binding protein [Candidatus Wallbacteria bacterium]|nr:ATP-binding protein [Candidatus Wallbacteria bacterium]